MWIRRAAFALVLALLMTSGVPFPGERSSMAPAEAAVPSGGMTASALAAMFRTYGDAGGHWTGGDGTTSVKLPDGRVVWLFSDTFLGSVNADGTRPPSQPMVRNSLVVQDGTSLGPTLTGGTALAPSALVQPANGKEWLWVGDGVVEGGVLKVIYNRYRLAGSGNLDFQLVGSELATFSLPDLAVSSVTPLPVGPRIAWGQSILVDGSWTYVYGTSSEPGSMRFGYLARAAAGSLGGAWQYWNGTGWVGEESAAARIVSGVGYGYGVQKVGTQYVLVTQENNLVFDPQIALYTATAPQGPFTGPRYVHTAPEVVSGQSKIVYNAQLHPALATSGKLLLSYDVNSLTDADNLADARLYRPRFLDITWPLPAVTGTPGAPTTLTVSSAADDKATLTWSSVSGASAYRIHQKNVTAGQLSYVRTKAQPTATTATVSGLIPGNRYEFRVTAQNANGEGAFSPVAAVTPHSTKTAAEVIADSGLPNAVPGRYIIRFKGEAHSRERVEDFGRALAAQHAGTDIKIFRGTRSMAGRFTEAAAIDLAASPDVRLVQQDTTGEQLFGQQAAAPWHLDRIDQQRLPRDTLYKYPNDGAGVRIYVVDTGVDSTVGDLAGRLEPGWNPGSQTPTGNVDNCGHGTRIAVSAAGAVGGVAKAATVVPVRVAFCDANGVHFPEDSVEEGLAWVADDVAARPGPAVVNISLGARGTKWNASVQTLVDEGLPVVVAAGNDAQDACGWSPAATSRDSAVLTLAASDVTDRVWDRSNYGECVSLHAPGVDIDVDGSVRAGTSYATALTSGAVAILLKAHLEYGPTEVKAAIEGAATKDVLTVPASKPGSRNLLLYVEQDNPPAPTGLAAQPRADGTIALSWSPVALPNIKYSVSLRDVTAGETTRSTWNAAPIAETTAVVGDLESGHQYEFAVAAVNNVGRGADSTPVLATARMQPPAAPTGLTATALNDGRIQVSWNALGADLFYWVYQRDVTAGETTARRLELPTTATSMAAAGLLDGHTYEFQVSASNAGGEGPRSAPASATSNYPPPAPPTGLTATAGNAQATLQWTASPTDGVWYHVYQRNVTRAESFARLPLPLSTCCTMTAGFLVNGDQYEFKVTALGGGNKESVASNTVRVTPLAPPPPAVTGLTATALTDGQIRLNWTSAGEGAWYTIYQRDATAGGTFAALPLPITSCCTMTAGFLTVGHRYEFKVSASLSGSAGPQSAVASAVSAVARPGAPTNLRGESAGNANIELTWDAPAPNVQYWIYQRNVTAGATTFTKLPLPLTTCCSFTAGLLTSGSTYEFKVTAANLGGEGPASNTVSVRATGGLPAAPTNLTATAGNGEARLAWTASATAGVSYSVYQRNATAGQSWQKLPLPLTTCCTFTAGLLTNGATYEFRLVASNTAGNSTFSNIASTRPMPPRPAAPTGLTATAANGQVTLRWSASTTSGVLYAVEQRQSGGSWTRLPTPASCCSMTAAYLVNGITYEFRVFANNLAGDSAASNTASARPTQPAPSAPSALTATAGDGRVTLRWTASPTAGVWYVIEQMPAGGSWTRLPIPITTCCTFTAGLLTNGVTYSFRIRATNSGGDSAASNTASAKPLPPLPGAPTNLRVTNPRHDFFRLDWSGPDLQNYRIYARNASRGGAWFIAVQTLGTSGTVRSGTAGDRYEYRVVGYNAAGEGPASNTTASYRAFTATSIRCFTTYGSVVDVLTSITYNIVYETFGVAPAAGARVSTNTVVIRNGLGYTEWPGTFTAGSNAAWTSGSRQGDRYTSVTGPASLSWLARASSVSGGFDMPLAESATVTSGASCSVT